jgi:hypothetical protein
MASNIFQKINDIPLTDLLDKLWIFYETVWNNLELYEGDKHTDGWRWDIGWGFIKDFAWKRAQGDRITFVMGYLGMEKWDSVRWFKDSFWLHDEWEKVNVRQEMLAIGIANINKEKAEQAIAEHTHVDVKAKWETMWELSQIQIEYLSSRCVNYEKVKRYIRNNVGYVCCPVSAISGTSIDMISLQSRDIHTKKFVIEKGTPSKWCFISAIDKSKKYIYVVEWMFDFLTLAQYTDNVVGMKSASDWADVVKEFAKKWYLPILIPDNDEAGKTMLALMANVPHSVFDLAEYNVKDINELLVKSEYGASILEIIEDMRTRPPRNIDSAMNKLNALQSLTKKRWRLGIDWPPALKKVTDLHQWIIEGKVYTIWAYSGHGKSTLSYEYASYFVKQRKKVLYFSVEVDSWLLLSYIARNYYKTPHRQIMNQEFKINPNDFETLYLYDTVRDLDTMSKIVMEEKPDFVFIDYAQGVRCEGASIFERTTSYALAIQALAIESNATIFSLSQLNNDSRNKDAGDVTLKWSGDLFSASDVIITISKDWEWLKLWLMKNKFWRKESFTVEFNYDVWWLYLASQEYEKSWV